MWRCIWPLCSRALWFRRAGWLGEREENGRGGEGEGKGTEARERGGGEVKGWKEGEERQQGDLEGKATLWENLEEILLKSLREAREDLALREESAPLERSSIE